MTPNPPDSWHDHEFNGDSRMKTNAGDLFDA